MKVEVHSFSKMPKELVGLASKANYGKRADGDSLIVWQSDFIEMKNVLRKHGEK